MIKTKYQKCLTSFWLGRKCVFCDKRRICLTSGGYIKKCFRSLEQFGKHLKVNHSKTLVDKHHNHINGIEGFWSYAKHKLYNYRGVSKSNFPLYIKRNGIPLQS